MSLAPYVHMYTLHEFSAHLNCFLISVLHLPQLLRCLRLDLLLFHTMLSKERESKAGRSTVANINDKI